jgi:hypothetical protein
VDDSKFDRLTRVLAAPASRRAAVAAILGGGMTALAPAVLAKRCGRRQVRCNGRCVRKQSLPCCPGGNCSIVDVCERTNCPPAGATKFVKLIVQNRSGKSLSLEFWRKKGLSCVKDRSLTLADGAVDDFASDTINAFAWIDERFGVEGSNPFIGTPFVGMVQDGRMNASECYVGSLVLGGYGLREGEGVRRTMGSASAGQLSFEMFRMVDTDEFKIFELTVHPA